LVELMVVVGIIFIMLAMALPQITSYMRTYRIRGGLRQAVDGLQKARNIALKKNSRNGVVFFVDQNHVGYFSEDLYNPATNQRVFQRQGYTAAQAAGEASMSALPSGIQFVSVATGSQYARFDNLGRPCAPTSGVPTCPPVASAPPLADTNNYLAPDAATGDTYLVLQDTAGLVQMRAVVGAGGRVKRQAQNASGGWVDDN
jgi:Tfp pilus assembly protein FimT